MAVREEWFVTLDMIRACPKQSLLASHYRPDQSCECVSPETYQRVTTTVRMAVAAHERFCDHTRRAGEAAERLAGLLAVLTEDEGLVFEELTRDGQ